jgi:alanyl-tRNA synthetase
MPLPSVDTVVGYPSGSTAGTSTVVHVEPLGDGRTAVLLESTPCHPVDAGWPDQGADHAMLGWGGGSASVVDRVVGDCIVAATDGAQLYLGANIPVRKGTEGWAFLVAHIVEGGVPEVGQTVTVTVDADYRRALSLGHTGCHLASLALNHALADRWGKEAALDALGVPDFDKLAIDSSTIQPFGSVDTFRLNKSLRRKGFVSEGLADALPEVERALNASLESWCAAGAAVTIRREGNRLTDRRYWECTLPEGEVSIACGGTHAASLAELNGLHATLTLSDDDGTAVLTMTTRMEES